MKIMKIYENKKQYLSLLLLADEQESMIDRYLERGELFALYDDDLKTICVVTNEGHGTFEIKNIATMPKYQRSGYGEKLINYLFSYYQNVCDIMIVGTGDSPLTIPFYKKLGFSESHRIKNFFIDNYDHDIFECGQQLVDMVYLKKIIR